MTEPQYPLELTPLPDGRVKLKIGTWEKILEREAAEKLIRGLREIYPEKFGS